MQEKEKEEVQREQLRKDVQEINDRGRRAERAAGNAAKHLYRIVAVALLGALVFVSSMLSVPIPVAIGDITRIHWAIFSACFPAFCWDLWAAGWRRESALPFTI